VSGTGVSAWINAAVLRMDAYQSSAVFEYTYIVRRLYPATATAGRLGVSELTSHYFEVNLVAFAINIFGVAGLRAQLTRAAIGKRARASCSISSASMRSMFLVLPVFSSS